MGQGNFTEDFKLDAIKQITKRGHSVADVSKRLGVSTHSLYSWMKRYTASPTAVVKDDQAAEIRWLKQERVENIVRAKGAWLLFLPPYSPDSTQSKWLFQNSNHGFEKLRPEPSMNSGRPSATSAVCSRTKNAQTTSPQLDMDSIDHPML